MIRHIVLHLTSRTARLVAAALAAVLVAATAGWALRGGESGPGTERPEHTTEDGAGLVDGAGPVTVEIWFALGCADCASVGDLARVLDKVVADGSVTRVYRPAVGDSDLVPLAATLGCAADRDAHPAYLAKLLAASAGNAVPATDKLIYLAGTTGLIDPAFARCVRAGQYREWARDLPDAARPPAVRVDGLAVQAHPEVVRSAVRAAIDLRAR